jgi:biopolymer transport protein ExbD
MAIKFDNSDSADDLEVMVEMNITPLIDVMLVLLVMLIITIPVQLHAVNVEMPVGPPPAEIIEPVVVKIEITRTDRLLWNGEPLTDQHALETRLESAARQGEPPEVHIQPDRAARYDTVAAVLTASQRFGLQKVGVVGLEQFAP